MIFLSNDIFEHNRLKSEGKTRVLALEDVVQEIFQAHTNGISYREWNAGYEIDNNMSSDGFNISLDVDLESGFILGGNMHSCLTWMDKMGSSKHADTKGIPATPRAGAPIELVGLLYASLLTFKKLHK
jgi:glycogen debranching enzyme